MKTFWETESGHLECHWCESDQSVQRTAPHIEETLKTRDRGVTPAFPDFARHSPLGSGEWFAPWNLRWSRPDRT